MSYVKIGNNVFRSKTTPIFFPDSDRLRHTYMIGKTGVGKSTLFANMALQDILNFHGVCFIDPHGESIDWLLGRIPEGRLEDVALFDPSDAEYPVGLNLLDAKTPQEKDFVVSELIGIFYKLFDPQKTGIIGPQFEHWLRNASLTVMSGEEGGSILEIPKLFTDKRFELKKRKSLKDPSVMEFWQNQMGKTSDFHKSEMLNYFSSKFGHFANNRLMKNILGQSQSGINFDEIIAKQKILLVNLSKGKIGELNAFALGLILTAKLQAAILKRSAMAQDKRLPFYLFVDEFQNLTSDTFASMLSESRKYGLGVHLTNQYFSQLPENIRSSILGNVGSLIAFQIGMEDAEKLTKEFHPFTEDDLTNLEKHNFYARLSLNGQISQPFSAVSLPPMDAPAKTAPENEIVKFSRLAYGKVKLLVEEQIKYQMS